MGHALIGGASVGTFRKIENLALWELFLRGYFGKCLYKVYRLYLSPEPTHKGNRNMQNIAVKVADACPPINTVALLVVIWWNVLRECILERIILLLRCCYVDHQPSQHRNKHMKVLMRKLCWKPFFFEAVLRFHLADCVRICAKYLVPSLHNRFVSKFLH